MIAAWMLYTLVVAALATGAAIGAERGMRALAPRAGVTRWPWVAATLFSVMLPAAALLRHAAPTTASMELIGDAQPYADAAPRAVPPLELVAARARALVDRAATALAPSLPADAARWNGVLAALWAVTAAAALARLALLVARLHRVRRRWPRSTVDGEAVLVADDVGPAVAGLGRGTIVLPRWAIGEDPSLVRLMVAHEREHLRAGDPWLLLVGTVAVALVPWNIPLHWQLRRLRLAIELDCDARVLRHHPDVRRYGTLLLAVGARATRLTTLPLAAMADRPHTLERRIRAMTTPRPRFRTALALGSAVPAILLVAVACETPRPGPLEPENRVSAAALASGSGSDTSVYMQKDATSRQLEVLVAQAAARGGSDEPVFIFRDTTGRVLRVQPSIEANAAGGVDAANISSVEVVKGAAAARLFGKAASGGIINVMMFTDVLVPLQRSDAAGTATRPTQVEAERAGSVRIRTLAPSMRSTAADSGVAAAAPTSGASAAGGRRVRLEATRLTVRRSGTTTDGPAPLYIIDGVEQAPGTDISKIAPESIVSIEVLKGESARARYGERAASGVVLITTRGRI